MRTYTEREKRTIRYITSVTNNGTFCADNLFIKEFGYHIVYDYNSGTLNVPYIDTPNYDIQQIQQLYELYLLLKSLKDEHLIYTLSYPDSTKFDKQNNSINTEDEKHKYIKIEISSDIKTIINEFKDKTIYATEELKWIVNNDFKTIDQQSLEEDRRQTQTSIYAMIATCLVGIYTILKDYIIKEYLLTSWMIIIWICIVLILISRSSKSNQKISQRSNDWIKFRMDLDKYKTRNEQNQSEFTSKDSQFNKDSNNLFKSHYQKKY